MRLNLSLENFCNHKFFLITTENYNKFLLAVPLCILQGIDTPLKSWYWPPSRGEEEEKEEEDTLETVDPPEVSQPQLAALHGLSYLL